MTDLANEPHGMPPTPKPLTAESAAAWQAAWFLEHDGRVWCRVCGCAVLEGWQEDHYKVAHGRGF